jgi:hypothetical protein
MEEVWREFLQTYDSVRLTHGLIINEQNYIEQRVVQKPFYRQEVLQSIPFQLQSLLSLNHVLFPYHSGIADEQPRLCGISVHRFASLEQRISIGKTLFHLLREDANRCNQIVNWAKQTPHSGSRADYWPDQFTSLPQNEGDLITSPTLEAAWQDVSHAPADGVDWFCDRAWLKQLETGDLLPIIDEHDYFRSLQLLRAGTALFHPFSS